MGKTAIDHPLSIAVLPIDRKSPLRCGTIYIWQPEMEIFYRLTYLFIGWHDIYRCFRCGIFALAMFFEFFFLFNIQIIISLKEKP